MNNLSNLLLIGCIIAIIIGFVAYRLLTASRSNETKELRDKEMYSLQNVTRAVQDAISSVTSRNLHNQGYSPEEFDRQTRRLKELKEALRNCNTGDLSSKIYVTEHIYDILKKGVGYDEESINLTIPFDNVNQLTNREIFDILLFVYSKEHGKKALGVLIEEFDLDQPKEGGGYCITAEEVHTIFSRKVRSLSFDDKLRLVTQRIYAHYKGFGVIDEIRDMSIDGVSGGVSGYMTKAENPDDDQLIIQSFHKTNINGLDSIWIMYKGNSIHFSFLQFDSEAELRRVVQNVYKYNAPGQLSETKPYIINEMADGSRVTAARPPFSNSWAFFVRKKYDAKKLELETLVIHEGKELVIEILRFLMRGARTTALTGAQGSGKTTVLISVVGDIHQSLNIRTIETAFELNLPVIYPKRNILSFQETNNINGQEALDFQKKTDGHVSVLGEVATDEVASQMIQAAQVASLFTLFTHHAKTADNLVESIRNSLVKTGSFKDEVGAERQVAEVLEFNVHLKQDYRGNRFIERITQIIPIEMKQDDIEKIKELNNDDEILKKLHIIYLQKQIQSKMFVTRNIIEFRDGQYVAVNPITEDKMNDMKMQMSQEDAERFDNLMREQRWEVS